MAMANKTARGLRGPQRLALWGAAAALLLAPAVAMRLTTEVAWGPEDFLTLAVMLFIAGGAVEIAAWRTTSAIRFRLTSAAIGLVFMLVWAQLAVGIW